MSKKGTNRVGAPLGKYKMPENFYERVLDYER